MDVNQLVATAEKAQDLIEAPAPEKPAFQIDSLTKADWALSVIAESEARKLQNAALAAAAKKRVDGWLEDQDAREDRETEMLRSLVIAYMETHRKDILGERSKKKSRAIPSGVIGWRQKTGGLAVIDPGALLEWARAQPVELDLVRVKHEPNVKAIKEYAEGAGLVPPGMEAVAPSDEPFLKATGTALVPSEN